MKRFYYSFAAAVSVMSILAVLAGCNRTEDALTAMVPVDRPCAVAVVDFNRLCGDFGVAVDQGHVTFPEYMQWIGEQLPSDKLDSYAAVLAHVDRFTMVGYAETGNVTNTFLSARLTDTDAFADAVAANVGGSWTTTGKYQTINCDGYSVLVDGTTAWFTKMPADSLDAIRARAKRTNLDRVAGVREALNATGFLKVGVMTDPGDDPDGQTGRWTVATLRVADASLVCETRPMLGDGKPTENEFFGPMSVDFLRYVPDDMTLLMAAGRSDKPVTAADINRWAESSIIPELVPRIPASQVRQIVNVLAPYIAQIDGTCAFGMQTQGGIGAMLMVHLPEQTLNEAINQLTAMAKSMGITPAIDQKLGIVTIDISHLVDSKMKVSVRNADGYLLVTTFDPMGTYNNSYATTFEGKNAAVYGMLPLADVVNGCNFGVRLRAQDQSDKATFDIDFPGSDKSFPQALVELLRLATLK